MNKYVTLKTNNYNYDLFNYILNEVTDYILQEYLLVITGKVYRDTYYDSYNLILEHQIDKYCYTITIIDYTKSEIKYIDIYKRNLLFQESVLYNKTSYSIKKINVDNFNYKISLNKCNDTYTFYMGNMCELISEALLSVRMDYEGIVG